MIADEHNYAVLLAAPVVDQRVVNPVAGPRPERPSIQPTLATLRRADVATTMRAADRSQGTHADSHVMLDRTQLDPGTTFEATQPRMVVLSVGEQDADDHREQHDDQESPHNPPHHDECGKPEQHLEHQPVSRWGSPDAASLSEIASAIWVIVAEIS